MSQPDDIDKLLREVEAMTNRQSGGTGQPPALPAATSSAVTGTSKGSRGGRLAWTGVSAVGGLAGGGVVGTVLAILPYVSTVSTAVGAAIGGALVGFVSGPPGWFDRD